MGRIMAQLEAISQTRYRKRGNQFKQMKKRSALKKNGGSIS